MLATLVCGVAAAALLPLGGLFGAQSLLNSAGGQRVDDDGALQIPDTPAALLATVDGEQRITSLTAFVLAPSGVGGTIISLPVGMQAEVVGNQTSHRVADTFAQAGIEGVLLEVEGVLDVTFSVVGAIGQPDLENVLAVVPSFATTQAGQVLYDRTTDIPEIERLVAIKSMWNDLAAAVGTGLSVEVAQYAPTSVVGEFPTEIGGFIRRILGGPVQVWQLSAQPLTETDNPLGLDMYSLDRFEVLMIMASVAPSSLSITADALTVQVDNPFNDANIMRAVTERLAFVNITVALVRNLQAPAAKETVIRASDLTTAELKNIGIEAFIGPVSFSKIDQQVQGIGAQLVLGQDLADFLLTAPALPSTTVAVDE